MPEQHVVEDPLVGLWVKIRQSRWRTIQQIATIEQRDPRAQAGKLLEWAADEWATRAVTEVA